MLPYQINMLRVKDVQTSSQHSSFSSLIQAICQHILHPYKHESFDRNCFLLLRQEILVTQRELVKNVFFDLFFHRCLLFPLQRMCCNSCKRWPHPSSFILLIPVRGDFLATDYERQVNSFTTGLISFRDIFRS